MYFSFLLWIAEESVNGGIEGEDSGIITPYDSQAKYNSSCNKPALCGHAYYR